MHPTNAGNVVYTTAAPHMATGAAPTTAPVYSVSAGYTSSGVPAGAHMTHAGSYTTQPLPPHMGQHMAAPPSAAHHPPHMAQPPPHMQHHYAATTGGAPVAAGGGVVMQHHPPHMQQLPPHMAASNLQRPPAQYTVSNHYYNI